MAEKRGSDKAGGFTADERAAMKERAAELKRQAKGKATREEGERDILAKIKEMPEPDRGIATRIHEIVSKTAPDLVPRTWYGMPAYSKDGDVLCFFQAASKFKSRYQMFGFSDKANLDDGAMWPTYYALAKLSPAEEKKIAALVKKAVS
jgi:uncharacterized protein YdhG (YjbR/CyaY superfamily)